MTAAPYLPEQLSLPRLREAVQGCRGCDLYKNATQAVFGEGTARAEVMLVGEQPGDKEDLEGRPFVGPAGKLLDAALDDAGIDREKVYLTNAVKHFKWERGPGKRRIHKKPNDTEIRACHPWLEAELSVIHPHVVVLLGATAAQALLGKAFRVTQSRGKVLRPWGDEPLVVATVHPSSVLRSPAGDREANEKAFRRDISKIAKYV